MRFQQEASVATGQLVMNLSKKDEAVVSDVKYSGDSYKETFASSKPSSERTTSKLKHTQTPVSTFLRRQDIYQEEVEGLEGPGVGGKETRKNKVTMEVVLTGFQCQHK